MSQVIIKVEHLSKLYRIGQRQSYGSLRDTIAGLVSRPFRAAARERNKFWALKDVSFEIRQGDVLGIIGSNGAGKSTLLKILSRITAPTEGRIEIEGRIGSLLEVGTGFHPELTGRENIFLNGAILGMKRADILRDFDRIVDFADVEKFIDTPIKHYSSGMYVRLAFAVAAHLEPEILLVDEVLAVGDVSFQNKCLGKMEEISHQGRTVVFVSHNMTAVKNLCKQALWLERGRLHLLGETSTIVDRYVADSFNALHGGVRDLSTPEARIGVQKSVLSEMLFRSITLCDSGGNTTGVFLESETILVRLGFELMTDAASLEIYVLVMSLDGAVVFSCCSGELGGLRDGTYQIEARVASNPLRTGTYKIRLYMRSGGWQDIIPDAVTFRVESMPDERLKSVLSHPGLWGLVRVSDVWTVPEPVHAGGKV